MKLTKSDKEILKNWGYDDEDIKQIEEATKKTIYFINDKKVSRKKVLEILDRKEYLSGISRSAFHFTSFRNSKTGEGVFFDSYKIFE